MNCEQHLQVQAWFDGEIDEQAARAVEAHMQGCAECRAWHADLLASRVQLREAWQGVAAPQDLRRRLRQALVTEPDDPAPSRKRDSVFWRARAFWVGAFSGGAGFAVAAALVLMLWLPRQREPLLEALTRDHLESLRNGALIAVESSDHHTVKPWFAGRADVSPVVQDFAPEGFTLAGGRTEAIPGQRAAVLVYRHQRHVINVFSWREPGPLSYTDTTLAGYHLLFWRIADVYYCAVSDAGWVELRRLRQLISEAGAEESSGRGS
ncbi:MAG: anti-sigma factor [Proteobacteria bacterium]|nr:anti-sigma factor [Pseudomonadota bacterium]